MYNLVTNRVKMIEIIILHNPIYIRGKCFILNTCININNSIPNNELEVWAGYNLIIST